ncbi:MAG TPA: hypothetical protein O0X27_03510 [Methanocorpusculum sp.]|nr:hypothetical protein [Methanocorpusculum sp.]
MHLKKLTLVLALTIVIIGSIFAAGCTSTTTGNQQASAASAPADAIWTFSENDDGVIKTFTMVFHPDGTGEKRTDKGYGDISLRRFTWEQPDNCHFLCTFDDGDIDTFTLTGDGKLTHDGKYYQCTQQGSLPVVSTPVAKPQDHPEIVGTWETYELKKKGLDTKTLEFKADGSGVKSKIKAKGTITTEPFTWVPVGSCYLIAYNDGYAEDDDTVRIVNGVLDHDGDQYSRT